MHVRHVHSRDAQQRKSSRSFAATMNQPWFASFLIIYRCLNSHTPRIVSLSLSFVHSTRVPSPHGFPRNAADLPGRCAKDEINSLESFASARVNRFRASSRETSLFVRLKYFGCESFLAIRIYIIQYVAVADRQRVCKLRRVFHYVDRIYFETG